MGSGETALQEGSHPRAGVPPVEGSHPRAGVPPVEGSHPRAGVPPVEGSGVFPPQATAIARWVKNYIEIMWLLLPTLLPTPYSPLPILKSDMGIQTDLISLCLHQFQKGFFQTRFAFMHFFYLNPCLHQEAD